MKYSHIWDGCIAIVLVIIIGFSLKPSSDIDLEISDEPPMSINPETPPERKGESFQQAAKSLPLVKSKAPLNMEKYGHIAERMDAMQQRRPERYFDPKEVDLAIKNDTVWATTKKIPQNLPLKPEQFEDGRQFIKLDALKIETLMPGDQIKIAIDEIGGEFAVTIDRTERHDYDSISWYGHIDGRDGQTYDVHFTRGQSLTVGGINTPEGHFVLQGHGNDGWIASSGSLFTIDPDHTDAIYPEDVVDQETVDNQENKNGSGG